MNIRLLSVTAFAILPLALNASTPVKSYSNFDRGIPAQESLEARLQTVEDFDVDAGPLPQQLNLVLTSRQVVFLYSFEELKGVEGAAVHGRLSLAAALQTMLEGTGCTHQLFADSISVLCSEHARARANPKMEHLADADRSVIKSKVAAHQGPPRTGPQ